MITPVIDLSSRLRQGWQRAPFDGALEKAKLAEHDALAHARMQEKTRLYRRCYAEVLPMSAEQAFDYYNTCHIEPWR